MTKKELFYFTGKCLMLDEDPSFREEILRKIEADALDWLAFTSFCSSHLILPVIYLKFKAHNLLKHLPEELAEYLHEVYDLNKSRNEQILMQLKDITEVLNKKGISPIFLKGSGNLLDGVYSDIGERILGDIDFLVMENEYFAAANELEADGYSIVDKYYDDIGNMQHYPGIFKPGVASHVEIHRLVTKNNRNQINNEKIEHEKKPVAAIIGCLVLPDKYKVVHNFIHSQLDDEGHANGLVSYRNLYDLFLLSKRTSLAQALGEIKSKKKAIAYFVFAGKAFGINERIYSGWNLSLWSFMKKHDLNFSSSVFYNINRVFVYIKHRILIGYGRLIIKSFTSNEVRRTVFKRLFDLKWYKSHLESYSSFIVKK